jgi:hypothetical protein
MVTPPNITLDIIKSIIAMMLGFLIYLTQIFIIIKLFKMRRRKHGRGRGRRVSRNYTIARGGIRL